MRSIAQYHECKLENMLTNCNTCFLRTCTIYTYIYIYRYMQCISIVACEETRVMAGMRARNGDKEKMN